MDIVIVYARPDDGVSIVNPAWNAKRDDEDDAAFLARVAQRSVPEGTSFSVMPRDQLPAYDSATRDRWRIDNGRVVIGPAPDPVPAPPDRIAVLEGQVAALIQALATARGGTE